MDNYDLAEKLKGAREASLEIAMLVRSIRAAVDTAEHCKVNDLAILPDAATYQREAIKIYVLANRIATLTARTDWPTSDELRAIPPEIAAADWTLSDEDCYA
jgi:hypothetical protein